MWLYWGMIVKIMQRLHFANPELFDFTFRNDGQPYDEAGYRALLFTLPAVAGLAGATLRIPNSFMIAICGGRNVKFMTTVHADHPGCCGRHRLQNPQTPFWVYIILAAMSGVGGGAFASSMSNISFFFPKRMQGLALGLNAGLGNAGVSVMQFLIPWAITFGLFGGLGGDPQEFVRTARRSTVDSERRADLGADHDRAGHRGLAAHEQPAAARVRPDAGRHRQVPVAADDRLLRGRRRRRAVGLRAAADSRVGADLSSCWSSAVVATLLGMRFMTPRDDSGAAQQASSRSSATSTTGS